MFAKNFLTAQYQIQMHSDYLNEDLICEFFVDQPEPEVSGHQPRREREEFSLNLTVTSRDSKSNAHLTSNNPQYIDSNHAITLALNEIDKFNNWAATMSTVASKADAEDQKALQELEGLVNQMQKISPMQLTMPDLSSIKKALNHHPNHSECPKCLDRKQAEEEAAFREAEKKTAKCDSCQSKDELIEIIKEQYEMKIEQCKEYGIKIQEIEEEWTSNLQIQLKKDLLEGVEANILREENEELKAQLAQLRGQIEKQKLEKSVILQKSNSLLRTKDHLQKRLETAHQKSFSNAKNSTNPTNLNDSMNRVESMICFGEAEPNIEELLRFYNDEAESFRDKVKKLLSDQSRRINRRLVEEAKNKFLAELPEKRILDNYRNIIYFLNELKKNKQQFSQSFCSIRSKKFQPLDTTTVNHQQSQELRKVITMLERDNLCLETQKKNLLETNDDLVEQIEQLTDKIRQLMERMQQKDDLLRQNEGKSKSFKSQLQKYQIEYKSMCHKYRHEMRERKKLTFEIEDMKGSIRVYCRVRPRLGTEIKQKAIVSCVSERKLLKDGKQFQFDQIFNERSSQQQIFAETKSLVQYAYEGKKLCIFAYGQTGSGKTFTIHGNQENPGLAQNIIGELFNLVERDKNVYKTDVLMNMVEIYKENIRDLMEISSKVEIKEDAQKGIYLEDCWPVRVKSHEEMMDMYERGISKRAKSQTDMNSESSRSHCILIINIEQTGLKTKGEQRFSKITLIDLAGAQKLTSSNPLVAKQTQFINKSLSSLVDVFSALKEKKQHIPYRNSKLTHLLKDSLTNKCNILTFINISPNQVNSAETTNSLNFGLKTRAIQRYQVQQPKSRPKENKENQKHKRSVTILSHA